MLPFFEAFPKNQGPPPLAAVDATHSHLCTHTHSHTKTRWEQLGNKKAHFRKVNPAYSVACSPMRGKM